MPKFNCAGLIVLLAKLQPALIKFFKFLKLGKVGLATASVASYAYVFTWKFAFVIVAAIFVHEYGHLRAMMYFKMKTRGIYLIPFFGGAAVAEEDFPSRRAQAICAIAGPLTGALSAVACWLIYLVSGNVFFAAITSWIALVNLFNLLPIAPLDGGKILGSIAFSIKNWFGLGTTIVGLLIATILAFKLGSSIFVILIVFGTFEFIVEWRSARNQNAALPIMSAPGNTLTFIAYIGLAACLWWLLILAEHVPGADLAMQILKG